MIAKVVPYTKTVRGVELFDYSIPPELAIERGDVVEIPFRSRMILGVVWSVLQHTITTAPLKPIGRVLSSTLWRDTHRLQLMEWFARYYCISLPTALKTLQWPIPKRPRATPQQPASTGPFLPQLEPGIQQKLNSALAVNRPIVVRWNTDDQRVQLYQHIIDRSQQTLIIVPEYTDCTHLRQTLSCASVRACTTEPSPSLLQTWSVVAEQSPTVTVGTKKLLSLPLQQFDTIIIDQEDARSHKQFDRNPRYHVRDVVVKYQSLRDDLRLVLSSAAPSTLAGYGVSELQWPFIDCGTPWTHPIEIVDMEDQRTQQNYSWFSEPVRTLLQQPNTTVLLFLNRTGTYRAALCRDCGTTVAIDAPTCPHCHGTHITKQRKGITTLEEELKHVIPHRPISRIEKDHSTATDITRGSVVIATEKIWRVTPLDVFDAIVILSVDHLLTFPHFRAHERVYELLVRLLRVGRPTIIQTSAPHHPVIRAAITNNYNAFLKHELPLRKLLHVPPYNERIQLIDTTTRTITAVSSLDCAAVPPTVIVDRQ